jgi:hypothetical protein
LACAVRCRSTKKRNYSGFGPMRQHFYVNFFASV